MSKKRNKDKKKKKRKSSNFIIYLVMFVMVVAAFIGMFAGNQSSDKSSKKDPFEVSLLHNENENQFIITGKKDDPVKLIDYEVKIRNLSDESKAITINGLSQELEKDQQVIYSSASFKDNTIFLEQLNNFDLKVGLNYNVEFYLLSDKSQVIEIEVLCKSLV